MEWIGFDKEADVEALDSASSRSESDSWAMETLVTGILFISNLEGQFHFRNGSAELFDS